MESLTVVERSAKFNNVAYLTEGLRSCVLEQRKPSVKHVTMLNSADLPHGIADTGSSLRNSTVLLISLRVCAAAVWSGENLRSNR